MSRKRTNWSTHIEPHICRHRDDPENPIEWCVCPIGEDHHGDDLRIEPHEVAHPQKEGEPGWWQNPVTQTMRGDVMAETPVMLAQRIALDPDAASDSDKLRSIADWIDLKDMQSGTTGTQAQDFLRGLAERLELS